MKNAILILFFLLSPNLAWASDYSGFYFILYFALFIPAAIIGLIIWLYNKSTGITSRVKCYIAMPFFILLTPVPMSPEYMPWPSALVLLGGDLKEKGIAIITIFIVTFIVWSFMKISGYLDDLVRQERTESDVRIRKAAEERILEDIKKRTNDL